MSLMPSFARSRLRQRNLLEWQQPTKPNRAAPQSGSYWTTMWCAPALALVTGVTLAYIVIIARGIPFLILWALLRSWRGVSQPLEQNCRLATQAHSSRSGVPNGVALKPCRSEENWLPPDNFQNIAADHRFTPSPTNVAWPFKHPGGVGFQISRCASGRPLADTFRRWVNGLSGPLLRLV
jgi:hypothetical protein